MTEERFIAQIRSALGGNIDPTEFEACTAEVLQRIYPTLVQIPGGTDSGRDGALDGKREPADFLVCTTQKRPEINLRKSLRSHREHGKPGTRVIFATSRQLSATARDSLTKVAEEQGYSLVQIYDQHNLAAELSRRSDLCRRLLGITGEPPALSKRPKSDRPISSSVIVGREDVSRWLTESKGDCLVTGQPGLGKTFLLYGFVQAQNAWFATSDRLDRVVEGVREHVPTAVVIDDAGSHLDLIRGLVHFREESGLAFRILASCWPAARQDALQALQSRADSRELDRLTRDEIVRVINGNGIHGPNELVREIVNQADGRPGLAVSLCDLCRRREFHALTLADALERDTRSLIRPLGANAYALLVGLAVGGDAGMPLLPVATALGISVADARHLAEEMELGGVLHEIADSRIAVRPAALRHALVRDGFFKGALSFQPQPLIDSAPRRLDVVETLCGARARGGNIPIAFILAQIPRLHECDALAMLAWVGPEESRAVLAVRTDYEAKVALPALEHIPSEVLPRLLAAAVGDTRAPHQATDHPIRVITDWVNSGRREVGESILRRKTLHSSAIEWMREGGDVAVGVQAIMIGLSPKFMRHDSDVGSGRRITLTFGTISSQEIETVAAQWPEALQCLSTTNGWQWSHVQNLIDQWSFPGRLSQRVSEEVVAAMRPHAEKMLRDLCDVANTNAVARQWIRSTASALSISLDVTVDPVVDVLFPTERHFDEAERRQQVAAVEAMATELAALSATEAVPKVVGLAKQADQLQQYYPRFDQYALAVIGQTVIDPVTWARMIIVHGGSASALGPFLVRARNLNANGWQDLLRDCMKHPLYRFAASHVALGSDDCTDDLRNDAVGGFDGSVDAVLGGVLRGEYTESSVRLLLQHTDSKVAAATARGVWLQANGREIPDALKGAWRDVVVRTMEDERDLGEIFGANPGLALPWLRARVLDRSRVLYEPDDSVVCAIDHLSLAERRDVLLALPSDSYIFAGVLRSLIRDDLDLLRDCMRVDRLRDLCPAVLHGQPDSQWQAFAVVALDAGYRPSEVVEAAYCGGMSWTGPLSDMWQGWADKFAALAGHTDSRMEEIRTLGREYAERRRDAALMEERRSEVFGG